MLCQTNKETQRWEEDGLMGLPVGGVGERKERMCVTQMHCTPSQRIYFLKRQIFQTFYSNGTTIIC